MLTVTLNDAELERELRRLERVMLELPGALPSQVFGAGLLAMARVALADARRTTAFRDRTRRLRRSLRARLVASRINGRRRARSAAQLRATAPHAHFIERGTVRQAARPFLEPALHATARQQLSAGAVAMRAEWLALTRALARGSASARIRRLAAE